MNRLIIIGNGFDLAHGLPTSYKDFILDYLISALRCAHSQRTYNDEVLKINSSLSTLRQDLIEELIETLKINSRILYPLLNNKSEVNIPTANMGGLMKFEFKNYFIKELLLSCCERWVDIEEFYYKALLKQVQNNQVGKRVEQLNAGIRFLTEKLEEYLSREIENPTVIEDILELCARSSFPWGADLIEPIESISDIKKIVFLNFNYTSTLSEYISRLKYKEKNISFELIQIHGKVGSPENPIIFGFGDEMDDNYKVLEKANDNRLLDYIKSFGYFKTNNYKRLERLVESKPFQVFVMGHSCGLSDRIMLNMIFEHQNCETIRVFYHRKGEGVDDYKALTQNISRHFNDKKLMRKKIVPKVGSMEMPQLN